MPPENWKEIALQMRCPEGALGVRVAHTMNKINRGMTLNAIHNLDIREGDAVLELGHGNCGHLNDLLKEAGNISYYGLEISEQMVCEAAKINEQRLSGQVSFTLYDGITIPFPDSMFDKIFTVNTLYFWEDPVKMLREIYRVLKPDGLFGLTFGEKDFMDVMPFTEHYFRIYTLSEVEKAVAGARFNIAGIDHQSECYKDKSGKEVPRRFITMVLKK